MVIVAITKIAGMKPRGSGSVDIVWTAFWQQQECSIAVLMFSVSAFRSLFVPSPTQPPAPRPQRDSPSEKGRRPLRRHPDADLFDTHETNGLPQIPNATITGMTTVIGSDRQSEEIAYQDQQPHRDHGHSTEMDTSNSSARDVELGHSMDSVLPHTRPETSNVKHSRSNGRRWWKGLKQPETARTASTVHTGYWDVMSMFRTRHSESVIQSKDPLESRP